MANKIKIDTSSSIQFSDDGNLVYFNVNIKDLFNVSSNYPGIKSLIRKAFTLSKQYIPIKTGLMRSSYTIEYISSDVAQIYFDPAKIVGRTRLGRTVKEYYPKYLIEKVKTFNWLDIVMKHFFNTLINDMIKLKKNQEDIDKLSIAAALLFLKQFDEQFKEKQEKYKKTQNREVK